jgi:hypothetical protein
MGKVVLKGWLRAWMCQVWSKMYNELMCERFGMVENPNCVCCGVVETPWHVVGECGHTKALECRDQAGRLGKKRMWELVQAETSRRTSPLDIDVANALQRMWKRGGRRSPPNVATWSEKHHTRY